MRPIWKKLLSGQLDTLLAAAREIDPTRAADLLSLRQHGTTDEVNVALSLLEARRRAQGRLENHDQLWLTVESVQQATRTSVARHKANRFGEIFERSPVIDLCCGIGSDAKALAERGEVILVDRDPLRLLLARTNLEQSGHIPWALHAEAETLPLPPLPLHIDPDRRDASKRRHLYHEMIPGPEVLESLFSRHPDTALKCGPGVDIDSLPAGELEFIQDGNDLVEATLWRGKLAGSVARRATLLPSGQSICGTPNSLEPHPDENPNWLHLPVAAIERAGLVAKLQESFSVGELHPGLGWLAGDGAIRTPWLRSFKVIEKMPWRLQKVQRWLRARGEGISTVKTRGVSENPEAIRKSLRGDGEQWTLAILRHGRKQIAWILAEIPHDELPQDGIDQPGIEN